MCLLQCGKGLAPRQATTNNQLTARDRMQQPAGGATPTVRVYRSCAGNVAGRLKATCAQCSSDFLSLAFLSLAGRASHPKSVHPSRR